MSDREKNQKDCNCNHDEKDTCDSKCKCHVEDAHDDCMCDDDCTCNHDHKHKDCDHDHKHKDCDHKHKDCDHDHKDCEHEKKKETASEKFNREYPPSDYDKDDEEPDSPEFHEFSERDRKTVRTLYESFEKVTNELKNSNELLQRRLDEMKNRAYTYQDDIARYIERNKNFENEAKKLAIENVALQILPVVDNFEHAFKKDNSETAKGFHMIYEGMRKIISDLEIEEIEAKGKEFNPMFHSAVISQKPKDKKDSGLVAEVVTKGYKFKGEDGKVIRHAQVVVFE
ncbi:MAG: nucleotide exchange factor GrpE [Clostridia bacterium]